MIPAEQNEMGQAIAAEPIKNAQVISIGEGRQMSDSNYRSIRRISSLII